MKLVLIFSSKHLKINCVLLSRFDHHLIELISIKSFCRIWSIGDWNICRVNSIIWCVRIQISACATPKFPNSILGYFLISGIYQLLIIVEIKTMSNCVYQSVLFIHFYHNTMNTSSFCKKIIFLMVWYVNL